MFSKPNPFEESVASATDENLTGENWELILGVCDKVAHSPPDSARDCIAAVQKRLSHQNSNVQLYALALADALMKNCDITVRREISSRSFTNSLKKLIYEKEKSVHESVRTRALGFIQSCAYEFRADPSLGLMNDFCKSLRADGIRFPTPEKPKKEVTDTDKQKEEEEFQLALALSLSESENRTAYKQPSASVDRKPQPTVKEEEPSVSRVRALYDFPPSEEGELGFQKGDKIRVVESVYRDWWKGELNGKTGIFPVNYVEKIVDPTPADLMKEAQIEAEVMNEIRNVERLLNMLDNTGPNSSVLENEEFENMYKSALNVRPKLVNLIEKYSMKKDELIGLNEKFLQAKKSYESMLNSSLERYTTTGQSSHYSPGNMGQAQPSGYGYPPSTAVYNPAQTSPPVHQQPPTSQEQHYYPPYPQQHYSPQAPYPPVQAPSSSSYPSQPIPDTSYGAYGTPSTQQPSYS